MSCGNPAVEADALMPRRKKYDRSRICVKCKKSQGNIVVRYAVYCRDCFVPLTIHKFRRSLEPFVNERPDGPRRTALRPTGNLLLGFSGGLGSTVLLDLIHRCYVSMDQTTIPSDGGTHHPRHERIWKRVAVCHVEVCDAFSGTQNRSAEVAELIARHDGIDLVQLRLQDAFDPEWWARTGGRQDLSHLHINVTKEDLQLEPRSSSSTPPTPLERLQAYLASLSTPTAVASAINDLIRLLLLYTAVETESSHLVLGTSLTNLAVSLISGVSQGRGFNLREEMQEEWVPELTAKQAKSGTTNAVSDQAQHRRRYVRVVRPLRDIGRKECAMWAWWMRLNVIGKAPWAWPGSKQEIGKLTRDFITGLETDYPSTVSTIVRTCTKVAPRGAVAGHCVLCARPIQEGVQEWKSRISIRERSTTLDGPQTEDVQAMSASLTPYLCYACHITLTSRSSRPPPPIHANFTKPSSTPVPVWAGSFLSEQDEVIRVIKMGDKEKKSAVQEFLLDE